MKSLEHICRSYTDVATEIWEEHGRISSSIWAIGRERFILAKPSPTGGSHDIRFRTVLHSMLAQAVSAEVLGSTDETFVQERLTGESCPAAGDLAALADHDPTVRTAIVTQALHTDSLDTFLVMARLGLKDNGTVEWEYDHISQADGGMVETLEYAALFVHDAIDRTVLDEFAEAMRWMVMEGEMT
jgi:hypothetical protein